MESLIPYAILILSVLAGVLGIILLISVLRPGRGRPDSAPAAASLATGTDVTLESPEVLPTPPDQVASSAPEPAPEPQLQAAAASDPGHVRELNEDCLLVLDLSFTRQSRPVTAHLYAVADGMGGQSAGEVASALAIRVLAESAGRALLEMPAEAEMPAVPDYATVLRQALEQANGAIRQAAQGDQRGMGTTMVAALLAGGEAYFVNVGDSRAYRISPAGIRQITVDHSLVEHLVETEQITREEARTHPERHLVYRSLGIAPEVEVDTFSFPLEPGDWLVLCSDGLNSMVTDADIHATVTAAPNPHAAAAALVERARAAGGEDNVTVVVVEVMAH